jgi:hypothetical protein
LAQWTTQIRPAYLRYGSVVSGASHEKSSRSGLLVPARHLAWSGGSDDFSDVALQMILVGREVT